MEDEGQVKWCVMSKTHYIPADVQNKPQLL